MRSDIIEAAAVLFAAHGLHAVSLKDVSEKAGIRHTSMYRIFKDKDELFDAVLSHVLDEVSANGKLLFSSGAPAREIVKAVVYNSLYHSVVGSIHRKLLFRALADEDEPALEKLIRHRKWGIEQFIARLGEICGPRDPHSVYFAITALSSGYMHFLPFFGKLRPLKPEEADPVQVTDAVLRMVLPEVDWPAVPLRRRLRDAGAAVLVDAPAPA